MRIGSITIGACFSFILMKPDPMRTYLTAINAAVLGTFGLNCSAYAQQAPAAPLQELSAVTVVGTVDALQSLDFLSPGSNFVISQEAIQEKGARRLDQALQYQAGIVSEPFGGDNKVDWFKIRGFDASTSLDGTPTTPNGFFVWKPEIFGVESVEVVKGADSSIFGASAVGGVVNLVTKRPHKEEAFSMAAEVGNNSRRGLSVDYNGIANESGSVYYRIVGVAREEDGQQRHTDMQTFYLAPSVTMDFSDRTSLTLLTSIQRENGTPTNGFMPAYGSLIGTPYGRIGRTTNLGEPYSDYLRRTQVSAGWLFRHEFADGWEFTQNYKFTRLDVDQQNTFAYGSDGNRQALRGYSYTNGDTNNNYIDNRVKGKVNWGKVEWVPTIGFDYLHSKTDGDNNGFGFVPNIDMFNPVYGAPFDVSGTPYNLKTRQLGAYFNSQVKVGSNWLFTGGIRHDKAEGDSLSSGTNADYDVSHNSRNFGAMYISDYGVSPYFNYTESFQPVAGSDGYGRGYKPYEGKQREVGLKFNPDWLNGTATLAYFDLEEKNALAADATNIQTQIGKRKNQGIEVSTDLRIGKATNLKLAYTHNNARQDVSSDQTVRVPLIPKNQFSAWVSHRLVLPSSQALTVAAGIRYNGSTVDERYYPDEKVGSFTLVDLMGLYEINRNWSVQLNVRNLTDKNYISGCDFYCYYGRGRTVDMQVKYQF